MTVLQQKSEGESPELRSFLIDAIRFKDSVGASLGRICENPDTLKVVEAGSLPQKLSEEFNCKLVNVVEVPSQVETSNCYSTVLIE